MEIMACWGHEFTSENRMVELSLRSYNNVGSFTFKESLELRYLIAEALQIQIDDFQWITPATLLA